MTRHTPGDDFPPHINPGIAMSCCSWGSVADFSASLIIISKYVEISSLEHQDEGGSLLTGQAQMSVSFHSWLQQQQCPRNSQGAQSQPCKGSSLLPATALLVDNSLLQAKITFPLAAPIPEQSPALPPTPAPLHPQTILFGLNPAVIWRLLLFLLLQTEATGSGMWSQDGKGSNHLQ